jgi:hypothetical protein
LARKEEEEPMVCNVSDRERAIRVGAGSAVILLGLFLPLPMWAMLVLVALGVVGLVTGLTGHCPAYRLMGRGGAGQA